jgi:hypothetical protein
MVDKYRYQCFRGMGYSFFRDEKINCFEEGSSMVL